MHTSVTLTLATLLPSDLATNTDGLHLNVPSWAFQPDEWSFAFLRGIKEMSLNGQCIWEVGCGTGLNLALVKHWFPNATIIGSDFDARCAELSITNLTTLCPGHAINVLQGSWDLVSHDTVPAPSGVDCIVACIPQVPKPHLDNGDSDDRAHYYEPGRYYEAHWHTLGLGLNDALLERAKQVLKPGGRVVLNLGGRPGKNVLLAMFNERGYDAIVLHEELIPQHAGTSLASLVALEVAGQAEFEFFGDLDARERITAHEAEARRHDGVPVYHKIYVIVGTLQR